MPTWRPVDEALTVPRSCVNVLPQLRRAHRSRGGDLPQVQPKNASPWSLARHKDRFGRLPERGADHRDDQHGHCIGKHRISIGDGGIENDPQLVRTQYAIDDLGDYWTGPCQHWRLCCPFVATLILRDH